MNKTRILILCILSAIVAPFLTSCDGFEISKNGELDGMWHLVQVDSVKVNCLPKDYTHESIYWSVQDNLLSVEDKQDKHLCLYLRFKREGDTLSTYEPYINHHREKPDEKTEDVTLLSPYGINNIEEKFFVEKINGDDMILKSDVVRLTFIRW